MVESSYISTGPPPFWGILVIGMPKGRQWFKTVAASAIVVSFLQGLLPELILSFGRPYSRLQEPLAHRS